MTGISYLSRQQESAARVLIGNPLSITHEVKSSSSPSVADSVFIERIKSRVNYWRNECKGSSAKADGKDNADSLIISESGISCSILFLSVFTRNLQTLL